MKTLLQVVIQEGNEGKSHNHETVVFETDLPNDPHPGLTIDQLAWKVSRAVKHVHLGISPDNELSMSRYMGFDFGRTMQECEQLVEMYKSHGWTTLREHLRM